MHDQCLFAEIASENSTLMQQFTELKRMHNLSLYSQSQWRELRDKIMTSKYQCLQWTNNALIPTGKFVSIYDLTNPHNFDEVYAGFSRWDPHTPGYRLEVSNAVRYTYGREANNMYEHLDQRDGHSLFFLKLLDLLLDAFDRCRERLERLHALLDVA